MASPTTITASSVSRAINDGFKKSGSKGHPFAVREGIHIEILFDRNLPRLVDYLAVLRAVLAENRYVFTVRTDLGKVLVTGKNPRR